MRSIAILACWLAIAFCTACAPGSAVRPGSLPAANPAASSAVPDRLAEVAARIDLALAEVCDCASAPDGAPASLRLCGYPVKIEAMAERQASTNGRRIRITTGMLRFFGHEDELAFVLAHELSHILLGHAGAFNGRSPRAVEMEADRLGIRIASKAGFDTEIAAKFPERLARANPRTNSRSGTYGMPAARRAMIASVLRGSAGRHEFADLRGKCST